MFKIANPIKIQDSQDAEPSASKTVVCVDVIVVLPAGPICVSVRLVVVPTPIPDEMETAIPINMAIETSLKTEEKTLALRINAQNIKPNEKANKKINSPVSSINIVNY